MNERHWSVLKNTKNDFLNKMWQLTSSPSNPASIYLLKVNNRNTRTRCEICSKLTIKTPERRHWHWSRVFIFNFEHISHLVLLYLLLTLNMYLPAGNVQTNISELVYWNSRIRRSTTCLCYFQFALKILSDGWAQLTITTATISHKSF